MYKARIWDKLLVALLGLLLVCQSVYLIVCCFHEGVRAQFLTVLQTIFAHNGLKALVIIAALCLIGLFALLIFSLVKPKPSPTEILRMHRSEAGDIVISEEAVIQIAQKTALEFEEVRSCRARLDMDDKGLQVQLRLGLAAQDDVTGLVERIQKELIERVKLLTGLDIGSVTVLVDTPQNLPTRTE